MKPGTLLSREPVDTAIPGAQAWRVRYASVDVRDVPHEVTGLVVAPVEPGADRPIVTWSHGTTGLGDVACPSAQPDPARELTTYFTPEATGQIDYGVPGLAGFITAGHVVCATDYQGLGSPGIHQYLVNRTNARDALFIAHAAREMGIAAGTRLGSIGWSQGGGSAAALAELDDSDFGDLRLVGTVLHSPAVASIAVGNPAGPSAALSGGAAAPDSHLLMLVMGAAAAHPQLRLGDLLTPLGVEIMTSVWNTQPVHHINDTVARLFRLKGAILRKDPQCMEDWNEAIASSSAARVQPRGAILLCVDSFDGGTVVPVAWQTGYREAMEALGASIEVRDFPDDDHFSLPISAEPVVQEWFAERW